MHRIDTVVDKSTWEMFRDVRDSMNLTQRGALEFALQLAFLFQSVHGKISRERFVEIGAMLMPKSQRANGGEGDPDPGEPQPTV